MQVKSLNKLTQTKKFSRNRQTKFICYQWYGFNDETILRLPKIHAKLINSAPLLSKKILQAFSGGFFLHLSGFGL